jgi:hypothetical protein
MEIKKMQFISNWHSADLIRKTQKKKKKTYQGVDVHEQYEAAYAAANVQTAEAHHVDDEQEDEAQGRAPPAAHHHHERTPQIQSAPKEDTVTYTVSTYSQHQRQKHGHIYSQHQRQKHSHINSLHQGKT